MSHPAFIQYPPQAAFGRTVPKNKIYDNGSVNARLKDLFVKQVEQIVWQYKLAPETIHLAARPGIAEIQVFQIQLKTPELHSDLLRCIDEAVQFPLIFELNFDSRAQVVAAYKRPNESDPSRWVISDYFTTDWLPADVSRTAMPVALHLGGLYERLLHTLIPLASRPQESLTDFVDRTHKVQSLQREVTKTISRLETEKQFNRKVEINAQLRQLQSQFEALSK